MDNPLYSNIHIYSLKEPFSLHDMDAESFLGVQRKQLYKLLQIPKRSTITIFSKANFEVGEDNNKRAKEYLNPSWFHPKSKLSDPHVFAQFLKPKDDAVRNHLEVYQGRIIQEDTDYTAIQNIGPQEGAIAKYYANYWMKLRQGSIDTNIHTPVRFDEKIRIN